jgi:hypothetical protein
MPKTNSKTAHTLEKRITAGRRKLQKLYDARGCTDSVVLAASIRLDKLINQYQKKLLNDTVPGFKLGVSSLKK